MPISHSGFTGQHGRFTTFIPRASPTPRILLGLGFAAGTPPSTAQEPMATTAFALPHTSFAMSSISRPPIIPWPGTVGIPPSTTQM